jgi:hypothetical protein
MWWSLKLGMPLCYALAIVLLTSIIGSMANVGVPKTSDPQSRQYLNCQKNCLASVDPNERYKTQACLAVCVPDEFKPILDRLQRFISLLTVLPLVVGTLFSFLWFFYIARSFKFPNAPLLGRQPGVLPLVLFGCGLLWAGLVGLKVAQWRNYSIGFLDFTSFGSMYSTDVIDDTSGYSKAFRGESDALLGLMISSTFVFYGAVFLVLHRQIGIGAALSGLVYQILALGGSVGIMAIMEGIGMKSDLLTVLVFVVPLSIPPLIGLYALFSGHRLRGLSLLGISTLLYLVSFGPMWIYLTIGIAGIPWASEFLKGKEILWYPLCFGASVIACEVLASLQYRNRLRPA